MANSDEQNYKIIDIPLNNKLSDIDKKHIVAINNWFSDDELILEIAENQVLIKLQKVNLSKLKHSIDELVSADGGDGLILYKILKAIESIKSYGLDSAKRRVYVGYNDERKVKNRTEKALQRGKYFYAKDANFSSKNNELPEAFKNKIICDDSETFLKRLPDNCIDLIFTSPPYNFGLEYSDHQDSIDWGKYLEKLYRVFDQCIRVTKYSGRIIVNVQPLFSDYIPLHHFISNYFTERQLIWKAEILWEKSNYNCKYTAWGSWKSPSNPYMKYTWEFLEVFCKGQMKKAGDKEKIDITGEEFKQWVYGKWHIAPEKNMKAFAHPAMFPEELARRVMKLFSYQEDVCLDPFMGVGTVPAVAKQHNRYYLGIDISREYCDQAIKRLKTIEPGLFSTIH